MDFQTFWLPKRGNSEAEYEDAFWPNSAEGRNGSRADSRAGNWRFAAADGATEASFSRLWARLLVRGFGRGRFGADDLANHLSAMQRLWTRIARRRPLPWYAEAAVENGAHAAFLGLELKSAKGKGSAHGEALARRRSHGTWRAFAAGDTCLFQIGAGKKLKVAFPISRSDEFGSRPHLLSSQPRHNATALKHASLHDGAWAAGDSFYLLTDALAAWFLRGVEKGGQPWETLQAFAEEADFRAWIEEQRRAGAMRNDDVTMVRVLLSS